MQMRYNPFLLLLLFIRFSLLIVFTLSLVPFIMLSRLFWQELPHKLAVLWAHLLLLLLGISLKKAGKLKNRQAHLYVCNHLSYIDIPILLCALKGRFRFIADECLFKIPLLNWLLHLCGYVGISHSGPKSMLASLKRAGQIIKSGHSVVIFCEGGINRTKDHSQLAKVEFGFLRISDFVECDIKMLTLYGLDNVQLNLAAFWKRCAVKLDQPVIRRAQFEKKERAEIASMLREINHTNYLQLKEQFFTK